MTYFENGVFWEWGILKMTYFENGVLGTPGFAFRIFVKNSKIPEFFGHPQKFFGVPQNFPIFFKKIRFFLATPQKFFGVPQKIFSIFFQKNPKFFQKF